MDNRWLNAILTGILLNVPNCGAKKPNIIIIVADDMVIIRDINSGFIPSVCVEDRIGLNLYYFAPDINSLMPWSGTKS